MSQWLKWITWFVILFHPVQLLSLIDFFDCWGNIGKTPPPLGMLLWVGFEVAIVIFSSVWSFVSNGQFIVKRSYWDVIVVGFEVAIRNSLLYDLFLIKPGIIRVAYMQIVNKFWNNETQRCKTSFSTRQKFPGSPHGDYVCCTMWVFVLPRRHILLSEWKIYYNRCHQSGWLPQENCCWIFPYPN